jgi:hypothetical protein
MALHRFVIGSILVCISITACCQASDTVFEFHRFTNGRISTKKTVLSDELNWGYARAYNLAGQVIYHWEIRNIAGFYQVEFSYFPSGAVQTAHYSGHPDGGIQWSDMTHYFDEFGKIIRLEDLSSDHMGHPKITIQPEQQEKSPETAQCAEIVETRVYIVNLTSLRKKVVLLPRRPYSEFTANEVYPLKNDTLFIGTYIDAQVYSPVNQTIDIINPENPKRKPLTVVWMNPEEYAHGRRNALICLVEDKKGKRPRFL